MVENKHDAIAITLFCSLITLKANFAKVIRYGHACRRASSSHVTVFADNILISRSSLSVPSTVIVVSMTFSRLIKVASYNFIRVQEVYTVNVQI